MFEFFMYGEDRERDTLRVPRPPDLRTSWISDSDSHYEFGREARSTSQSPRVKTVQHSAWIKEGDSEAHAKMEESLKSERSGMLVVPDSSLRSRDDGSGGASMHLWGTSVDPGREGKRSSGGGWRSQLQAPGDAEEAERGRVLVSFFRMTTVGSGEEKTFAVGNIQKNITSDFQGRPPSLTGLNHDAVMHQVLVELPTSLRHPALERSYNQNDTDQKQGR
ncbi:hypothetical protein B0H11DRAFT_1942225 [Mycena galericulata]|nr:hypothetical protein B0H11DRAFT_1942225 [Mycena galericulata]